MEGQYFSQADYGDVYAPAPEIQTAGELLDKVSYDVKKDLKKTPAANAKSDDIPLRS